MIPKPGRLAVTDLNKGELLSSWQPQSSAVVQVRFYGSRDLLTFVEINPQTQRSLETCALSHFSQLCITADETSVWSLGKDGVLVHSSLLSEHCRFKERSGKNWV